ncbi:2963_t:CDS:2, partial [Ambispora gerdemannii]
RSSSSESSCPISGKDSSNLIRSTNLRCDKKAQRSVENLFEARGPAILQDRSKPNLTGRRNNKIHEGIKKSTTAHRRLQVQQRIIEDRSFTLGPAPRAATTFSYSPQVAGTIPFKFNNHELGLQKRIIENRSFTLGPAPRAATTFSYSPQ